MNFDDFQNQVLKSVAIKDKSVAALAHRTLGLTGESGIIADVVKKAIRDNNGELTEKDIKLLKEKLGDVLYYTAVLAQYADLNLEDIATQQLAKSAAFLKNRQK